VFSRVLLILTNYSTVHSLCTSPVFDDGTYSLNIGLVFLGPFDNLDRPVCTLVSVKSKPPRLISIIESCYANFFAQNLAWDGVVKIAFNGFL